MIKDKFNIKFREYVKNNLSPNDKDRSFVSLVYDSFRAVLNQSCIQIGSYSRFTAIRPLHDLDIIYILGKWNNQNHNPMVALKILKEKIEKEYKNPTKLSFKASFQTHSVTVSFMEKDVEVFSVDIVPGYIFNKNEFGGDVYMVPEIVLQRHGARRVEYYKEMESRQKEIGWVATDPRGYIEIAKRINDANSDFRKMVKLVKAWRNACKVKDDEFKLKSFHIEQVLTAYFQENIHLDIFDSVFKFFVELPEIIEKARIKDRANNDRYIDDYVNTMPLRLKEKIIRARDCFLIKLESFSESDQVVSLLSPCYYERKGSSEQFLFDFNIPTLVDEKYSFKVYGEVQEREGGFRKFILDQIGLISVDRKIKFRIIENSPKVDLFKWKVRNDDASNQPRGEITDHYTRNDPESTKFVGDHFVECYAILNNVCVSRARQNVKLQRPY